MFPRCLSILPFLTFPVFANERFPDVDLWLPKSYENHFLRMLDATERLSSEIDCYEVLSGKLSEKHSTLEKPVFYFVCRTESRRTIAKLVDAETLTVRDPLVDRRVDQRELLHKNHTAYWESCFEDIEQRVQFLESIEYLTSLPPTPEIDKNLRITYRVDLNAKSASKKTLKYRVFCFIGGNKEKKVTLKSRHSSMSQ